MPGSTAKIEAVEHPISFTCVDMFVHDGLQLVMITKKDRDLLYLPGGFIDPSDSSSVRAAVREIGEEIGLSIDFRDLNDVDEFLTQDTYRYNPEISKHRLRTKLYEIDINEAKYTKELKLDIDTEAGDDALTVEMIPMEKFRDVDWAFKHVVAGHLALIYTTLAKQGIKF